MTAPSATQPEAAPAASRDLNGDTVTEILLRLPSASVLRFRAVCKAWRRITSSPAFVAAHARRRPLELIIQHHDSAAASVGTLETIPLATLDEASRRRIRVRYPYDDAYPEPKGADYWWRAYHLVASCDGLLLFSRGLAYRDYLVCNPVTGQRTMLPRPPGSDFVLPCGFYVHGPSGEHRLLCLTEDREGSHYVLSVEAAGRARRLGQALPVCDLVTRLPLPHVNHRGRLHWLSHPDVIFSGENLRRVMVEERSKILAFDTVSETFRRVRRPPQREYRGQTGHPFLLDMDGMLAVADFLDVSMDVWVLSDYDNDESWTRRLRVDLPPPLKNACWAMTPAGVEQGRSVILVGNSRTGWVGLHDITERKVLNRFQLAADSESTRLNALVFRDSLDRHPFFSFSKKRKYRPEESDDGILT